LGHSKSQPFNLAWLQPGADLIHARHGQSLQRMQGGAIIQGGVVRAVFGNQMPGRFDAHTSAPVGDLIEMRLAETLSEKPVVVRPHGILGRVDQILLHILAQSAPGGSAIFLFRSVKITKQQVRLARQ
jgi:hypothetical protein